ncbi:amidase domain-containing protein [Caloramator sp. mosi_1]|uniref:amidase domain-containing protein n=1 Tax=Caloramator sp. mosi_1 TaxID=3023090 RepID=UPI00235FD077|nr:amidase domain-containing protein [Caloramator sp. mosi_1]WDC83325.1 amidase domain-containing protein [Caloramator sp. mosi_1]
MNLNYNSNKYDRNRAVKYALRYALSPNSDFRYFASHGDGGGDCSNFVSQCLLAGGAQMDAKSQKPWWYKNGYNRQHDTWSVSWSVAHSLYWTLKSRTELKLPGIKAIEIPDISGLETGDIIQYENKNGVIYHSAIVTDLTYEKGSRVPLISQHSFDAMNISYVKPAASKAHFMKIWI